MQNKIFWTKIFKEQNLSHNLQVVSRGMGCWNNRPIPFGHNWITSFSTHKKCLRPSLPLPVVLTEPVVVVVAAVDGADFVEAGLVLAGCQLQCWAGARGAWWCGSLAGLYPVERFSYRLSYDTQLGSTVVKNKKI